MNLDLTSVTVKNAAGDYLINRAHRDVFAVRSQQNVGCTPQDGALERDAGPVRIVCKNWAAITVSKYEQVRVTGLKVLARFKGASRLHNGIQRAMDKAGTAGRRLDPFR